jgi:hypothetical protein
MDAAASFLFFEREVQLAALSSSETPSSTTTTTSTKAAAASPLAAYGLRLSGPATKVLSRRHAEGCFVSEVQASSAASAAKLVDGDYLLAINGVNAVGLAPAVAVARIVQLLATHGKVQLRVECNAIYLLQANFTKLQKVRHGRLRLREFWVDNSGTRIRWISHNKSSREASIRTTLLKDIRFGRPVLLSPHRPPPTPLLLLLSWPLISGSPALPLPS